MFCLFLSANETSDNSTYNLAEVEGKITKSSIQKWLDHDFGLRPYKVNYILAYGVGAEAYESDIPSVE